ncbi:MAG: hypothetical protein LJE85_02675 [Gammaproteobacteria bacterium]|nr:hypothetical protein [Gammaproteobacteria bacterium]
MLTVAGDSNLLTYFTFLEYRWSGSGSRTTLWPGYGRVTTMLSDRLAVLQTGW